MTQSASSVPLPISVSGVAALVRTGIAAPLYYVSASQLNVQIPYETPMNSAAMLSVNNNGQVTTQSFQVTAAAPGIFTDSNGALVPTATAAPGQELAFYITGAGAVSPAVSTGAAPSRIHGACEPSGARADDHGNHRRSRGNHRFHRHSFRAGGSDADQCAQVPSGIASGAQAVIVTVGGVASAPATITIN